MALSMDEQRILAEIEQHLARGDPGLAARLSSFGRAGPGRALRLPRARVAGSVAALIAVAIVSAVVYALIPFRVLPGTSAGHPVTTRAVTTAQSSQKPQGSQEPQSSQKLDSQKQGSQKTPPSPRTASPAAGPQHTRSH